MTDSNDTSLMGQDVHFKTTRWNLVQTAQDLNALDALINIYWKPLYFFIRQRGYDNETSKDIVQDFLTTFLERGAFGKADPGRGRFRTYLLTSLENYLKDLKKAARSQKRGGGRAVQSLDFERGEADFKAQVDRDEAPLVALNKAWARSLWEQSLSELTGDAANLEAFRLYREDRDLKTIAATTGMTPSAAQSAIHRLKGRLKDIVVGHIRETVSAEADLQSEVAEFMALLK